MTEKLIIIEPPKEPQRYFEDIAFCKTLETEYSNDLGTWQKPVKETLETIHKLQAVRGLRESLEKIVEGNPL